MGFYTCRAARLVAAATLMFLLSVNSVHSPHGPQNQWCSPIGRRCKAPWQCCEDSGLLHLQAGKPAEACAFLAAKLEVVPSAKLHCQLGSALRLLGKTRDAAFHFQAALALNPDHPCAQAVTRQTREAPLSAICRLACHPHSGLANPFWKDSLSINSAPLTGSTRVCLNLA